MEIKGKVCVSSEQITASLSHTAELFQFKSSSNSSPIVLLVSYKYFNGRCVSFVPEGKGWPS